MRLYLLDFQPAPQWTGAVFHNMKAIPDPAGELSEIPTPSSITLSSIPLPDRLIRTIISAARRAMFVRTDYGFARDPVEMQSGGRVRDGNFLRRPPACTGQCRCLTNAASAVTNRAVPFPQDASLGNGACFGHPVIN